MNPLIQCVPNFSEGRDMAVVEAIVKAARDASTVSIVDYSADADHNRMVLTLLGTPAEIYDSVLAAAKVAVQSIDLRKHIGVHPRIGAVDVVPFVPINDISMEECVTLSHLVGKGMAEVLHIPVFFYEQSATMSQRTNLADIRRGGFEKMVEMGLVGDNTPDLGGGHTVHPTAGSTVVGARGPLVAYNVILDSDDLVVAKAIARKIRIGESGLPNVKAIGVPLKSRGQVQVSMNVTRPDLVTLGEVFSYIESEARTAGINPVESEIIGALRSSQFGDVSPEQIKALHFKKTQVLDGWIQDRLQAS